MHLEIRAGKLIPIGDRVETCLQEISRPPTPLEVRKFLKTTQPAPGVIRVLSGKANDPDITCDLVHGVSSKTSLNAGSLINPPPQTLFQQRLHEISEAGYTSKSKAPLGRSHDQSAGLPKWYSDKTTFGVQSVRRVDAGQIINPLKTAALLETEACKGHKAYVHSHNAYFVGEPIYRKYDWSRYRQNGKFGISTPHFNDGRRVAKSLQWPCDTQRGHNVTSKICDDFRQRTQSQTGKAIDPIADTLKGPPDCTFGIRLPLDEFGAAELIHSGDPGRYPRGRDRQHGLVSAVQHALKKANCHIFPSLLQAFRHYDKKGNGMIDREDLREVCREFQVYASEAVLDGLMETCDIDEDGVINFLEFANFLNWKDKMPISSAEQRILTDGSDPADMQRTSLDGETTARGKALINPEDLEPVEVGGTLKVPRTVRWARTVPDHFLTSSSLIRPVVGGTWSSGQRASGLPAVRTDLPAPCIKRLSDTNNYGEEDSVEHLLHPSLLSQWGVHKEPLFRSRSLEEIAEIFLNVGVDLSTETLERAWELASMRQPNGEVCVQVFREVLQEIKAM